MNYIKNIRFLSTREEYNCSLLSKLSSGRSVQSVCDPVFLLSKIEWQQLLDSVIKEANDYVLCYFLDTPNEDVAMQIVLLLRGLNKSVLFLGNAMQKFSRFFKFAYKFVDVSAFSFPEMVFSSTAVLTDSFHGIAFSIIGEKKVYWFPRNYISGGSQDVRILSLLKSFSIDHAKDCELIKKENSNELIEECILSSKTYLLSSVEVIKNE